MEGFLVSTLIVCYVFIAICTTYRAFCVTRESSRCLGWEWTRSPNWMGARHVFAVPVDETSGLPLRRRAQRSGDLRAQTD